METRKTVPTWRLIPEFIMAVLVMAFLLAGPEGLDTLGRRIRQFLYSQSHPARSSSAAVPAGSAAARASESPPAVTPKANGRPLPVAPAVTRTVTVEPRVPPAPAPAMKPAVDRTRSAPPPPRSRLRRPTPTPVAEVAPPPLSPQQYLARLIREGHQLYQAGWYGPAAARFKEAARVSPGSASVQLWYGRSALRMGRTAEARAALERAIALAPSSDAAREARALLERMSGTE
jgi:TolA-binding protein